MRAAAKPKPALLKSTQPLSRKAGQQALPQPRPKKKRALQHLPCDDDLVGISDG